MAAADPASRPPAGSGTTAYSISRVGLREAFEHTCRGGRVIVPELAAGVPWPAVPDRTARVARLDDQLWARGDTAAGPAVREVDSLFVAHPAAAARLARVRIHDLRAAKGVGRMLTVSEVAFLFLCRAGVGEDGVLRGTPSSEEVARRLSVPGMKEIQMAVVVEEFVPSQGWGEYPPCLAPGLGSQPSGPADAIGLLPELRMFDLPFGLAPRTPVAAGAAAPRFGFLKTSDDLASLWVPVGGMTGVRFASSESRLSTVFLFQPIVAGPDEDRLRFSGSPEGQPLQLAIYDTPDKDDGGASLMEPGAVATGDSASRTYKMPPSEPPHHESFRHFIDATAMVAQ